MKTFDELKYVIDWDLDEGPFRRLIQDLLHQTKRLGKVVPLPIRPAPGLGRELLILLVSGVRCEGCNAACCRIPDKDPEISVLPPEYEQLSAKYGPQHFIKSSDGYALPMPCPFLKGNRCSIYADRPLVCLFYPFQPGAHDEAHVLFAVSSSCPEGRRIAREVYFTSWQLRRQMLRLGVEFLAEFTGGRGI